MDREAGSTLRGLDKHEIVTNIYTKGLLFFLYLLHTLCINSSLNLEALNSARERKTPWVPKY